MEQNLKATLLRDTRQPKILQFIRFWQPEEGSMASLRADLCLRETQHAQTRWIADMNGERF